METQNFFQSLARALHGHLDSLSALNAACDETGAYVVESDPLLSKRISQLTSTLEVSLMELDAIIESHESLKLTLTPCTSAKAPESCLPREALSDAFKKVEFTNQSVRHAIQELDAYIVDVCISHTNGIDQNSMRKLYLSGMRQRLAFDKGTELSARDVWTQTFEYLALDALTTNPDVFEYLFLHSAFGFGAQHAERAVEILIHKGLSSSLGALTCLPTLNLQNSHLLYVAVQCGSFESVKHLLALPTISVNVKTRLGTTPLMQAVKSVQIECCKALIQHPQLEINATDSNRKTAFHYALEKGCDEITQLFIDHVSTNLNTEDVEGNQTLVTATNFASASTFAQLIAHPRINVNLLNSNNQSVLMRVILFYKTHETNISALLESPLLDVNLGDETYKRTPLMLAMSYGTTEAVKKLLSRKDINLHAFDNEGRSVLEHAVMTFCRQSAQNMFVFFNDARCDTKLELLRCKSSKSDRILDRFRKNNLDLLEDLISCFIDSPQFFYEKYCVQQFLISFT